MLVSEQWNYRNKRFDIVVSELPFIPQEDLRRINASLVELLLLNWHVNSGPAGTISFYTGGIRIHLGAFVTRLRRILDVPSLQNERFKYKLPDNFTYYL